MDFGGVESVFVLWLCHVTHWWKYCAEHSDIVDWLIFSFLKRKNIIAKLEWQYKYKSTKTSTSICSNSSDQEIHIFYVTEELF